MTFFTKKLQNSREVIRNSRFWELLAPNIEGIEGIRTVGAVLQEILLRLCQFFPTLVLAEAIATARHASRLDGKDKIIVVLTIEKRHQSLLASEALVD